MARRAARARCYCWTLNNPTPAEVKRLGEIDVSYLIYGEETGDSGTPHLQGYVRWKHPKTFMAAKKVLGDRFHLEVAKGSAAANIKYCSKDGVVTEKGSRPEQGKRNDLIKLKDDIKAGKSVMELFEDNTQGMFKYRQSALAYRLECRKKETKRFEPVKVYVLIGEAGHGKTRWAYDNYPDVYDYQYEQGNWWDGYDGEKAILIDDFYGGIKYHYLLRLLDGYKFNIPIKGGFTWKSWDTVIITSNQEPGMWYSAGMTPALKRRITSCWEVKDGKLDHFPGWEEHNKKDQVSDSEQESGGEGEGE